MKIILTSVIVFLGVLSACSPTKPPTTIKVQRVSQDLNFIPKKISKTTFGSLDITVIPIDAKQMDIISYDASVNSDGNYGKQAVLATLIENSLNNNRLSKQDRRNLELKKEVLKYIDMLKSKNTVSEEVSEELKRKVYYENDYGLNGLEDGSVSADAPDKLNPYKINNKYLSVFEVVIENSGANVEKLNIDEFMVITGFEQLVPLKTEYFEKLFSENKSDQEKVKNVYRFNLANQTVIPPKQKIIKYIAVPSIKSQNNKLELKIIRENSVTNFEFLVEETNLSNEVILDKFNFLDTQNTSTSGFDAVVIKFGNKPIALKEGDYFIDRDFNTKLLDIYSLSIDPTWYRYRLCKYIGFNPSKNKTDEVSLKCEDWIKLK